MVLATWADDPLGLMIGPVPVREFFAEFHQRSPLLCANREHDRFAALLTLAQVDDFLDTADLRHDVIALARAGRVIEPGAYVGASGRVISSAVAEEYLKGATIILQHLHASIGRLGDFCRALEAIFSAHVQANIYLTPPGEQGFDPHADNHDVFILQLSGRKSWRLHPCAPDGGGVTHILNPGDCLYLPRGQVHDAASVGDAPSLHITIGLVTRSWADLLAAAMRELAAREPALGAGLPPGHARAGFAAEGLRQHLVILAQRLSDPVILDSALNSLVDDYLRERRPKIAGLVASDSSLGQAYRARPLVQWRLREIGRELVLVGPGGDLVFERLERPALTLALSGVPFDPRSLPAADSRRLFRRLWANGYLEPVPLFNDS